MEDQFFVEIIISRSRNDAKKRCLRYVLISSSAPRSREATYTHILLSDVEQDQSPNGNGGREAIIVGAGVCDGKGERA